MQQCHSPKQLLVVGPLPPPIGGGTINVQLLLDELMKYKHITAVALNISPNKVVKDHYLISIEKAIRSISIIFRYQKLIKNVDATILIATHSFIFTIGFVLLAIAKFYGVPFFIKPLGAEIKNRFITQKEYRKRFMIATLRWASGVMFQTEQLQKLFYNLGIHNAHHIPGYRDSPADAIFKKHNPSNFRIVFISQIIAEKGPLLLLEALQSLTNLDGVKIECDFFGPIIKEDKKRYLAMLELTPGAKYCGIADSRTVPTLLTQYDALVFPTFCDSEGHPGVIIEAMHAGIPIISSHFEAAPELITDEHNGLLVPIGDRIALSSAIIRLATNRQLQLQMAEANQQMRKKYRSDRVVSKMVELMF